MLRVQLQDDKSILAVAKKVYCLTGTRTWRRYQETGQQVSGRRTICSFVEKQEKQCRSPIKWPPANRSQECFCLDHQKLTPWWWRKGLISSSRALHHSSAARLAFAIEHQDKGIFIMCMCLMWYSGDTVESILMSFDCSMSITGRYQDEILRTTFTASLLVQWAHGSFHYITMVNLIWLENVHSSWMKALLLLAGSNLNRPKPNCASLRHDVMLYPSTKMSRPRRSWSWLIPSSRPGMTHPRKPSVNPSLWFPNTVESV